MITIHVPHSNRSAVAQQLAVLAGDARAVRAGTAGFVVEDDIAVAYLTQLADPCCATAPPAKPMPGGLAAVVQEAEISSGVYDPERKPKAATPPRNTRGRRSTTTAPEE